MAMGGDKKTKTSEILKKTIIVVMSDEKARKIAEIKRRLEDEGMVIGRDYNSNHLSGVLNKLKQEGYLKNPSRGVYQKESDEKELIEKEERIEAAQSQEELLQDLLVFKGELRKRLNSDIQFVTRYLETVQSVELSEATFQQLSALSSVMKIKEGLAELVKE